MLTYSYYRKNDGFVKLIFFTSKSNNFWKKKKKTPGSNKTLKIYETSAAIREQTFA